MADKGTVPVRRSKRVRELRHRAQSLVEGANDPWDNSEEYETVIPEEEQEEFIDEGTAELAEEVIEYTNMGREILCEAILGYIWWSLIFAIAPMIWFYPLNELEISGYEAFVVSILSPFLTCIGSVMEFCQSLHGIAILRALSMVGIASFQAPTTLSRLMMLSFGCGTAMLWFCGIVWNKKASERSLCFWGLVLGFFLMLASRALYISINPLWGDLFLNKAILLLGVFALLDRVYTGYMASNNDVRHSGVCSQIKGLQWILVSCGFGALLFLTHTVFGEISLVCRWAVAGYPDIGPSPVPWGFAVFLALAVGTLLSPCSFTSSVSWWLVGVCGSSLLYFAPRYWSLLGGLILGIYLMSIWPSMIDRLHCCSAASTLTLANLIYILLMLGSVWVVAYNFVPGGEYTRERTHVILAITMVFIGLAMTVQRTYDPKEEYGKAKKEDKPTEEKPTHQQASVSYCISFPDVGEIQFEFFNTHVKPGLFFLVLAVGTIVFMRHSHLHYPTPVKKDQRVFTAMIWTVHFGYDNKGWPSFERAAQAIEDTEADIIGFLESDTSKPYLGNNDLAGWFQERLHMYPDFGPSTRDHTWGATLFSKYPFVKSEHHLLPSPEGELAPAISATVNISGSLVDFVLVHMGNDRDDLDRKLQAKELARIMDKSPNPVVFLGYVTSAPGSRDYQTLLKEGRVKDIDETDHQRWCEYIMYRGVTRLGYARISHGGLSDTEMQVGRFRIPTGDNRDLDHPVSTTSSSGIPKHIQFSDRFGSYYVGHYSGNHHYHMSTPKYFLPTKG